MKTSNPLLTLPLFFLSVTSALSQEIFVEEQQNTNNPVGVVNGDLEIRGDLPGGTVPARLSVDDESYLSVIGKPYGSLTTNLGNGGVAEVYGPVKIGNSTFITDFRFVTSATSGVKFDGLPLGTYQNAGQIEVVATTRGNLDYFSARWVIAAPRNTNREASKEVHSLVCLEHQAAGDAKNLELWGVSDRGNLTLYVKDNNSFTGSTETLTVRTTCQSGSSSATNYPKFIFDADSTKTNGIIPVNTPFHPNGTLNYPQKFHVLESSTTTSASFQSPQFTKSINGELKVEGEATFEGRLVLEAPLGDVSMGVFGE